MPKRILVPVIGGLLFIAAGVALAANFASNKQVDFFAPGTHQFYVWCVGKGDHVATAEGANAEQAQMKLYNAGKAKGQATCWPVWQARIAG